MIWFPRIELSEILNVLDQSQKRDESISGPTEHTKYLAGSFVLAPPNPAGWDWQLLIPSVFLTLVLDIVIDAAYRHVH